MPVLYSEHLIGDGQQMFEHAARLNWEGIVSKRAERDALGVGLGFPDQGRQALAQLGG